MINTLIKYNVPNISNLQHIDQRLQLGPERVYNSGPPFGRTALRGARGPWA